MPAQQWAVCHYTYGTDYTDPRCTNPAFDPAQLAYVEGFGERTYDAERMIAGQAAYYYRQTNSASLRRSMVNATARMHHLIVWGAACYSHHVADRAGFFQLRALGVTMADMVRVRTCCNCDASSAACYVDGLVGLRSDRGIDCAQNFLSAAITRDQWPGSEIERCLDFSVCTASDSCVATGGTAVLELAK
jgi:hypothetical protein